MMMKKIVFILSLIMFFPLFSSGQQVADTIYRLGGRKLIANVVKVNQMDIDYMFEGDANIYSIDRKQVQKIVYETGKVEEFNKPIFIEIDETSWEAILVTEDKAEVAGLYKYGNIDAKSSPGSKNNKKAKKTAVIRLQKKAANMKGAIVLITRVELKSGYGEMPSYYMEGEVYGFEPPPEEEEDLPLEN